MNRLQRLSTIASTVVLGCALLRPYAAQGAESNPSTTRTVAAAKAFLASLDDAKRAKAVFAYTDARQRANWSNLPTGIYQRAGIRLGDLTAAQKQAAMAVLAASLSPMGYQKVVEIVDADEVLKGEGGPGGLIFGKDEFYLSFVGTPSETDPWMWQFGGHHLAINATIAGARGVLTPSLTATQPATYQLNGKTVRPLGRENDLAFKLVNSLNEEQRGSAVLKYKVADLVLGPGRDGKTIAPEGIPGSKLTEEQKVILLDLVHEWVGIDNDSNASAKLAEIKASINDTWFAWSGPLTNGSPVYFRVQGPTVVIEYAPQKLGGNPANHIHTIYRDPTNDYGKKFGGL
jgi:hypothetical protein